MVQMIVAFICQRVITACFCHNLQELETLYEILYHTMLMLEIEDALT
jgi:hypothetical protein